MNIVKFPGLDLSFNVSRLAFSIFGIAIYKYAVCIVLGMALGIVVCKVNAEKTSIKFEDILVKFVLTIIFGIIGARLYYVVFNLSYYKDNVLEIFNIRDGGLAIYGGLILGFIYLIISFRDNKNKFLPFLDFLAPAVALAQSIGRWGNFFNIEAYGYETTSFLRMGITQSGKYIEVHPVFLYESICTFIIFIILQIMLNRKKFDGQVFLMYVIMYSGIRMFLEGFRIDSLMLFGIRVSRALSALLFVLASLSYIIKSKKVHK